MVETRKIMYHLIIREIIIREHPKKDVRLTQERGVEISMIIVWLVCIKISSIDPTPSPKFDIFWWTPYNGSCGVHARAQSTKSLGKLPSALPNKSVGPP